MCPLFLQPPERKLPQSSLFLTPASSRPSYIDLSTDDGQMRSIPSPFLANDGARCTAHLVAGSAVLISGVLGEGD